MTEQLHFILRTEHQRALWSLGVGPARRFVGPPGRATDYRGLGAEAGYGKALHSK